MPTDIPANGCRILDSLEFNSRGEIDRAGQRYFEDRNDQKAARIIKSYREFRINCLQTSLSILQSADLPERCIVSARLKRMQSIYRKLIRSKQSHSLGNMDDIIGFRVICETYQAACELINRIRTLPEHLKSKSYLEEEHYQKTGYRASHHIMRFEQPRDYKNTMNVRFEIQVRTYFQHQWALWCESYGDQAKEGFPGRNDEFTRNLKQDFSDVSQQIAVWEEAHAEETQKDLPRCIGGINVAIVWRPEGASPQCSVYYDNTTNTIDYLNYLESQPTQEVSNTLMLIGISSGENVPDILRKTHPRFISARYDLTPENWCHFLQKAKHRSF